MEARAIVRQAMAILTPAVPARMEDGHQMLTHWTRKIIVEEGHTVPQLVHILHLIVQHFRVRISLGLFGSDCRLNVNAVFKVTPEQNRPVHLLPLS